MAVSAPPVQVVLALPETTTPLGNVSVNGALRLAAVVPELLKVIVRVDVPPASMVAGLKGLAERGWDGSARRPAARGDGDCVGIHRH